MQPRVVWLGVPGGDARSAFVDANRRLPQVRFDVADGETTIGTLQRTVLPDTGVCGPVLDCFLAVPDDWTAETVVPGFVVAEPQPAGWSPPTRWRAVPIDEVRFDGPAELHGRFEQWRAERAGAAPDPLAPPWSRGGWHAQVTDWTDNALADTGRKRADDLEQVRAWGISSVLRTRDTDGRRYWFKAVCEHFRTEVQITVALHASARGLVPPVIAADHANGWLLMGDIAGDQSTPAATGETASHASAFAALRTLQRAATGRTRELLDSGVASRPLTLLADQLADTLADPDLHRWHGAAPERADTLAAWVAEQVDRIAALGLPDVLVHGDFHPGNVAELGDGRRVVFDWSDAAFAPPFIDVVTWLSWLDDGDEPVREQVWRSFAAQWTDVLSEDEWLAWRPVLGGVAGAYHTVSYAGIVRNLDEVRRSEMADGIRQFFGMLDRAVPVTTT
jgi:aminoglycoside/choline kinase family phosphotransferase